MDQARNRKPALSSLVLVLALVTSPSGTTLLELALGGSAWSTKGMLHNDLRATSNHSIVRWNSGVGLKDLRREKKKRKTVKAKQSGSKAHPKAKAVSIRPKTGAMH